MNLWKNNTAVGIASLAVIIIASVCLVRGMRGPKPPVYMYPQHLKCDNCQAVFVKEISTRQGFPVACEKCGKKTAYPAIKCFDCGAVSCLKSTRGPEAMGTCPACGSRRAGPVGTPEEDIMMLYGPPPGAKPGD